MFLNVCKETFHISHVLISQKVKGVLMWNLRHIIFIWIQRYWQIFKCALVRLKVFFSQDNLAHETPYISFTNKLLKFLKFVRPTSDQTCSLNYPNWLTLLIIVSFELSRLNPNEFHLSLITSLHHIVFCSNIQKQPPEMFYK